MRLAVSAFVLVFVACSNTGASPSGATFSSVAVSSTPAAAAGPWIQGQDLIARLTAAHGYEWFESTVDGTDAFDSADPEDDPGSFIRVLEPTDEPANVRVVFRADERLSEVRHVERVAEQLAPETQAWIADAIDRGLEWEGDVFDDSTVTAHGGRVIVSVVLVGHGVVIVAFAPTANVPPSPRPS